MNKINVKQDWMIWLIMLAPVIYAFLVWDKLPGQLPVHFGFNGKADGFASKTGTMLIFPGLNLLVYFALVFLPGIDPMKASYERFEKSYRMLRISISGLFSALFFLVMAYSMDLPLGQPRYLFTVLFIFFAIFGNYLKTVRPNFFIGIRTPWTLMNAESWRKTHALTGKIWFLGGLAGFILTLFLPESWLGYLMLIFILVSTILAVAASYFYYRNANGTMESMR